MIATDCQRYDCQLGKRRCTYQIVERDYRCNDCGGRPVRLWQDGWVVRCGRCGAEDLIHEYQYQRQEGEAWEVLDGLPPELAALMKGD